MWGNLMKRLVFAMILSLCPSLGHSVYLVGSKPTMVAWPSPQAGQQFYVQTPGTYYSYNGAAGYQQFIQSSILTATPTISPTRTPSPTPTSTPYLNNSNVYLNADLNTILGTGAGGLPQTIQASENTFVGDHSGYLFAGAGMIVGGSAFFGNSSGYFTTGNGNTLLGAAAGYDITTGNFNTAVGQDAMDFGVASAQNTCLGAYAGYGAGMGDANFSANVFIGFKCGYSDVSGNANVGIGQQSLYTDTTGESNLAIGYESLKNNTTGSYNIGLGQWALRENETGGYNIALGPNAGRYETGSNSFYLDNKDEGNTAGDKANALLYGHFDSTTSNQELHINGQFTCPYTITGSKYAVGATPTPGFSGNVTIGGGVTLHINSGIVTGYN